MRITWCSEARHFKLEGCTEATLPEGFMWWNGEAYTVKPKYVAALKGKVDGLTISKDAFSRIKNELAALEPRSLLSDFKPYVPPPPPEQHCKYCGDPVYFYELPDVCLWCEQTVVDKAAQASALLFPEVLHGTTNEASTDVVHVDC